MRFSLPSASIRLASAGAMSKRPLIALLVWLAGGLDPWLVAAAPVRAGRLAVCVAGGLGIYVLALLAEVSADAAMARLIESPRLTEKQLADLIIDVCGDRLNAKGANFVPADLFFARLDRQRYRHRE